MKKKRLNIKKVSLATPTYTGTRSSDSIGMQLFQYDASQCIEDKKYNIQNFKKFKQDEEQYWLNVDGIHDVELVTTICNKMNIHALAIQDIVDVNQRTKFQDYDNYWFFSIRSIVPTSEPTLTSLKEKSQDTNQGTAKEGTSYGLQRELMSFILGPNFLISFQEKKGDYFEHIRERLRKGVGITRERTTDYLLYLLLESILDNYIKTVDHIDGSIEELGFLGYDKDPSPEIIKALERSKRQISIIKKTILTIKDFLSRTERNSGGFIKDSHLKYYLDLKDMCLSLIDDCDSVLAKIESSTNLFFSIQGDRMNQVMKTLTVVSTIFIPLTFIAGIYGMNFMYMPELTWRWGYFGAWGVMIVIFAGMLHFFKKKKWF